MTPIHCPSCHTELPPDALACPACRSLIHADTLKQLATDAEAAARANDLAGARDRWAQVLQLLPPQSQQYGGVSERIAELSRRIGAASAPGDARAGTTQNPPWWRRGAPGLIALAILVLSKLKFLVLGLTKASTFVSMFAFFGVYWSTYGWPLALGLVFSIYIHEMGHVAMLRQLGIAAGAPLFIPGVGAVVMLKQHITDPLIDAKIGLAGPVWGLAAGLAAFAIYKVSGISIWLAIAQLTGFINLFNLIPVWQLDGSRGCRVLAHWERWALVAAIALALALTGQRILVIVGAVAVWRALQRDAGTGDTRILGTFVGLVFGLAWLARDVG